MPEDDQAARRVREALTDDASPYPARYGARFGADGLPLDPDDGADAEIIAWQVNSPYYVAPPPERRHKHIIDVLIRERAVRLSQSKLWGLYRVGLNKLLGYKRAKAMVDVAGRMNAGDAFAHASGLLSMKLDVTGLEHVPQAGAFILAVNHPTGIADGLAIHDALAPVRPDVVIFVNADAIRLNPRLTPKLIPVEWREDKKSRAKSRETLKATKAAFEEGRCVVIFPSGRLAYMDDDAPGGPTLTERAWMTTAVNLARRYGVPIVPAHITSRNSWLYYWFNNVDEELRNMTLFYELLNKKGQTFEIRIGEAVPVDALEGDDQAATEALQAYVTDEAGGVRAGTSFGAWRARLPGAAPAR